VEKALELYFGYKVRDQDKSWTPRSGCSKKTIPLQAWRGPEGSRRLMLPDFKTIGT